MNENRSQLMQSLVWAFEMYALEIYCISIPSHVFDIWPMVTVLNFAKPIFT